MIGGLSGIIAFVTTKLPVASDEAVEGIEPIGDEGTGG